MTKADDFYYSIADAIYVSGLSVVSRKSGEVLYAASGKRSLTSWLCNYLYLKYYACDEDGLRRFLNHESKYGTIVDLEDPSIVREAISGCDHKRCIDHSWRRIDDGLFITDGSIVLKCESDSFAEINGKEYIVRSPIQRFLLPGWLYISGMHGFDPVQLKEVHRYYHSVSDSASLSEAFRLMTSLLNFEGIEYKAKIANNKSGLARNDALVLYSKCLLPAEILRKTGPLFDSGGHVWKRCPFVCSLPGGWGYAKELFESPNSYFASYGQKCCFGLAQALAVAGEDVELAVELMRNCSADRGFDPNEPSE